MSDLRIIRLADGNYPMTEQEMRDELGGNVLLPVELTDDHVRYVGYAIVTQVPRPSEEHWETDPVEIEGVYVQQWAE